MISINATKDLDGNLHQVIIRMDNATAALMPKGVRLSASGWTYITFRGNGANGGRNETGAKRMRSLFKAADKLGVGIVFRHRAEVLDEMSVRFWNAKGTLLDATRANVEAEIATLLG